MFINANSFKVDGMNLSPYITNIEYQYPKLWGDDTGRNLAGNFNGTLLGIFPKFIVTFRKLSSSELQTIAPILDKKYQTVTYSDPVKGTISKKTYTGDWSAKYKNTGKADGFTVSFICTTKR